MVGFYIFSYLQGVEASESRTISDSAFFWFMHHCLHSYFMSWGNLFRFWILSFVLLRCTCKTLLVLGLRVRVDKNHTSSSVGQCWRSCAPPSSLSLGIIAAGTAWQLTLGLRTPQSWRESCRPGGHSQQGVVREAAAHNGCCTGYRSDIDGVFEMSRKQNE